MKHNNCFLLVLSFCVIDYSDGLIRSIPRNLQFGVATSAYQIEGGWNASDKGESIWDRYVRTSPLVNNRSTGDVACDSYHLYNRDIQMLQESGVNFYRFSISWPRLLPTGFKNKISTDGSAYYNRLINGLIAAGITPVVTLYHWDLPQSIQDIGGWLNPSIVDYLTDYADIVFRLYGDRVKTWFTVNEAISICVEGYGFITKAPGLPFIGKGEYICGHNILKAHASVYHLYDQVYRPSQKGRIGIVMNSIWMEPATQRLSDIEAANRANNFYSGWLAHPIFSNEGDYPQVMKDTIARISKKQGFKESRLPEFTQDEINWIQGSSDFIGLNHYTSLMVKSSSIVLKPLRLIPSILTDVGVIIFQNSSWPRTGASWLKVVPWGFGKILRWIRDQYGNPEVFVAENGYADDGEINDDNRINYHTAYINAMLDAMEDGCRVSAYTAWSLMDNFEWVDAYSVRFGFYHVDFNSPQRTRVAKKSVSFYKNLIATKMINRV